MFDTMYPSALLDNSRLKCGFRAEIIQRSKDRPEGTCNKKTSDVLLLEISNIPFHIPPQERSIPSLQESRIGPDPHPAWQHDSPQYSPMHF